MFGYLKSFIPDVKKYIPTMLGGTTQEFVPNLKDLDSYETLEFEKYIESSPEKHSIKYLNEFTHFSTETYFKLEQEVEEARQKKIEAERLKSNPDLKNNEEKALIDHELEFQMDEKKQIESSNQTKYVEYQVIEGDTLFGIALKFNTSVENLKYDNDIYEDYIFPGQILKIPEIVVLKSEELFNKESEQFISEDSDERIEISFSKKREAENLGTNFSAELKNHKYQMAYCTGYGEIEGLLTLNPYLIMFDPHFHETKQKVSEKSVINFQACIDLVDVVDFFIVTLPAKGATALSEEENEYNKEFYLQILVSNVGNKVIETKYADKIAQMKKERLAFASLFFKFKDRNSDGEGFKNSEKKEKMDELIKILKGHAEIRMGEARDAEESLSTSTKIPFYDLLYENLIKTFQSIKGKPDLSISNDIAASESTSLSLMSSRPDNKVYNAFPDFIPELNEESNIIDTTKVLQIVAHIPAIYKLRNWKLVYSTLRHGTSYNTLLNQCEYIGPNIFVIKEFERYIFGAFCSEGMRLSQFFFGNGESFLFTFQDSEKIKCFQWTGANNDILIASEEGIGIGCGDKYGIFVDQELFKGYSSHCETFNNSILSKNEQFKIEFLEIWSLDC